MFPSKIDRSNYHALTNSQTLILKLTCTVRTDLLKLTLLPLYSFWIGLDTAQIPWVKQSAEGMVLHKKNKCKKYEKLSGINLLRK